MSPPEKRPRAGLPVHDAMMAKRPRGGRSRLRLFALLVFTKRATPSEAFARAGYPVRGVNVPVDYHPAWLPEQVGERAAELLRSARVQQFFVEWALDPEDLAKSYRTRAIAKLCEHLDATTPKGHPDYPTQQRAIENILDRTGLPRRQTIRQEHAHEVSITAEEARKQFAELIELERQGNQFLPVPVEPGPPARSEQTPEPDRAIPVTVDRGRE